MLFASYNDKFFRCLRLYDNKYINSTIGINSDKYINKEDITRIAVNGWNERNNYAYIIKSINKMEITNLVNMSNIIKKVCFDLDQEVNDVNQNNLKIIIDFCLANNIQVYSVGGTIAENAIAIASLYEF